MIKPQPGQLAAVCCRPTACPIAPAQATFQTIVQRNATKAGQEYLHHLAESRRIARSGEDAVADYQKLHLRTPDPEALSTAHLMLANFLDDIWLSAGARQDDVPILVLWNLNHVGSSLDEEKTGWRDRANAFQLLLQQRPSNSMGVILHKRAVSHLSRRSFHNNIAQHLEARNLELDIDLSLNYSRSHGNNRDSLTCHGWLCFSKGASGQSLAAKSLWAQSALLAGSIGELEQVRTEEMLAPMDAATRAFDAAAPGDISIKMRSQLTPQSTYERLVQEAVRGIKPKATNRDGVPMAVVCIVDNYNSAPGLALLKLQKEGCLAPRTAAGTSQSLTAEGPLDIRGILFPCSDTARDVVDFALKENAYRAWFNRQMVIPGHQRPPPQPWQDTYPEEPVFEVACLNSRGAFMVPQTAFKPFLDSDLVCMEAHAVMSRIQVAADSPSALLWTKLTPGSGGRLALPAGVVADVHEAPSTMPDAAGVTSVADLKKDGVLLADTPTPGGKMHVYVTKSNMAYIHVLADASVSRGERLLGLGSGGRKSEAEAEKCKEQKQACFPLEITSDSVEVFFPLAAGSGERLLTLYALLSQLTLDGHRKVGLSYHTLEAMEPHAQTGGLDRYKVQKVRPKFWGAKRARTREDEAGANNKLDCANIGALLNFDAIPNHYVKAS